MHSEGKCQRGFLLSLSGLEFCKAERPTGKKLELLPFNIEKLIREP